MNLFAEIVAVRTSKHYPELYQNEYDYQLSDGEDTQMICFTSTIDDATVAYLLNHTPIGMEDTAFAKMLRAIESYDPEKSQTLLGAMFNS
jgi:hypothetical protein